jgi:hypothetical protein
VPGPHPRFDDQEWRKPGDPVSRDDEVDPQADRPESAGKLAAQVRRTFLLRLLASGTYCSRFYYRQGAGRRLTRHSRVCFATTHEADISMHDARSAVRGIWTTRR